MSRLIKFRLWNKKLKKFLDYYRLGKLDNYNVFGFETIHIIKDREPNPKKDYKNNDVILQQFTGLIDKNNKEVYEGDLVKITSDCEGREPCSPTHKETSPAMEVYWDSEWNGFHARFIPSYNKDIYEQHSLPTIYQAPNELEVIGHIYE